MREQQLVPTSQPMQVISIHLDDASEALLRRALSKPEEFELAGTFQQYFGEKDAALVRFIRDRRPDVCLIDLDLDREMAIQTVEFISRTTPSSMAIFAVSASLDSESIIAAMRSGCTEYLTKPLQPERLKDALAQLSRKRHQAEIPVAQGKLIAFKGVKGGVGTTTLAVQVAHCLAKREHRTLLIDAHTDLGDATLHLGLEHHNYGFYELVHNLQRLDAELLQGFVLKHPSGLDLLPSPEMLGSSSRVTGDSVLLTLRALIRMYDYVLVDCMQGMGELTLAVLEASDELNLVSSIDLPSARNLARYTEYLARLNYPAAKTKILINRRSKNSSISVEQIEKVLARKIDSTIPYSEVEFTEAISAGIPVQTRPKSELMQVLTSLADGIDGGHAKSTSPLESGSVSQKSRFGLLRITS